MELLLTISRSRTLEISRGTPGGYPIPLDLHLSLMSMTGDTVRNRNSIGSICTLHSSYIKLIQYQNIKHT